jgi:hypothetical protein
MSGLALTLGGGGFAIDHALANVSRVQLQSAIDAATLSGVQALDGTTEGMARAGAITLDFAYRNTVLQVPLYLEESEVEVGTWEGATQRFRPWTGGDPEAVDAVRVRHAMTPVGLTFASFAPTSAWFTVEVESISVRDPIAVTP